MHRKSNFGEQKTAFFHPKRGAGVIGMRLAYTKSTMAKKSIVSPSGDDKGALSTQKELCSSVKGA